MMSFYRIYCLEGGRSYVGSLRKDPVFGEWEIRFKREFRYYVQNFSGTKQDCVDYLRNSFKGVLEEVHIK